MMIGEVCHDLKNYFCNDSDKVFGKFKIEGGLLRFSDESKTLEIAENQYYRISGSVFNDGVWQYHEPTEPEEGEEGEEGEEPEEKTTEQLTDEGEFVGSVWLMRVPRDFVALVSDIEAWQEKYGAADSAANSPFQSESFGGYSYSKSSGGSSGGSSSITWQNAFASRLNKWRKILL